jgi:putative transposase
LSWGDLGFRFGCKSASPFLLLEGRHGMARPFSNDLRERVVAAVERERLSRRRAASRFGVGISTVISWLRRYRETGSVTPGKMGGNRPKKLVGVHREWLIQRCRQQDFTLRGLVVELGERGLKVDYRWVWAFVHAERLSYKKDMSGRRAKPPGRRSPARAMDRPPTPD